VVYLPSWVCPRETESILAKIRVFAGAGRNKRSSDRSSRNRHPQQRQKQQMEKETFDVVVEEER